VASAAFSWRYFTRAFPLLSLDIRMDRQDALARARELATTSSLVRRITGDAASFSLDETVQTSSSSKAAASRRSTRWFVDHLFFAVPLARAPLQRARAARGDLRVCGRWLAQRFRRNVEGRRAGRPRRSRGARHRRIGGCARGVRVDLAPFKPSSIPRNSGLGGRVDHAFVYELPDRASARADRLRLGVDGTN